MPETPALCESADICDETVTDDDWNWYLSVTSDEPWGWTE